MNNTTQANGSANGFSSSARFSTFKDDLLASVVVFLVALPLCMGIAIASGVPVAAGLITGIVGGIVVGALAGCPLQVSGPAAGLTVVVYEIVQEFGLEVLGLAVLIAGGFQIVAGLLHLGQWFRAVSPAVIRGMLAGIGVLIFASQFHVMVDDKPKGSGLQNLITIPQAVWKGLGVPEVADRDTRRFHTEFLRTVGELHRQQVEIAERVSEVVPNPALHRADAPQEWSARAESRRAELVAAQSRVTERLEAAIRELQTFERATDGPRAEGIQDSARTAVVKSLAALRALESGGPDEVVSAQNEAVTALETLLGKQKNHEYAALLGILTIGMILVWPGLAPKRLKFVPAPLVAVVITTLVAFVAVVPVLYVEVPDNLWENVRFPSMAILQDVAWSDLLQTALLIAAIASAETLLCATAVDQMHQGPRTRYDKELVAQGVGNTICGALGALPMTGVIVRSTANVQAGGKTRLSAILHGVWLLIFVASLPWVLRQIPTASLAAILVYTGYKLINPKSILQLLQYGWGEVAVYAITVGMIVVTDLLTGVLVGIALAAVKLLYSISRLHVSLETEPGNKRATLQLHGAATFLRLPRLASALEKVPSAVELHVDFQNLDYIDHACLDLLMNWAKQHESTGGKLVVDWDLLHACFQRSNGGEESPAQQVRTPATV